MSTPSRRVVGYCRVSTHEQAERGFGLDVQRQRIGEYTDREGLRLVARFEDPGVSGTTPLALRPGLTEALSLVEAGTADALLVARLDRLARDTLEALLIERAFKEAGGDVIYTEGMNGDDATAEFMRTVLAGAATFEKKNLAARMNAARRRKAEQGGYAGGRPPFGYRAERGQLVPDEAEGDVVRYVFQKVAVDRWSVRKIARRLDETRELERRWDRSTVATILGRERYKLGKPEARVVDPRLYNRAREVLEDRRSRPTADLASGA